MGQDRLVAVPVVVRPEYDFCFEQFDGCTVVHSRVYVKWAPAVRRAYLRDWEQLVALHGRPIYALHDPGDRKHEKFLALVGMKHITTVQGNAGPVDIYGRT